MHLLDDLVADVPSSPPALHLGVRTRSIALTFHCPLSRPYSREFIGTDGGSCGRRYSSITGACRWRREGHLGLRFYGVQNFLSLRGPGAFTSAMRHASGFASPLLDFSTRG